MPARLRLRPAVAGAFLVLALLPCRVALAQDAAPDPVAGLIAAARQLLAPDSRTAVFDVHPTLTGTTVTLTGEIHSAAMKKELLAVLSKDPRYTFDDQLQALPHPDLGDRIFGVVSVSVANIRTKPAHAAEMATQALLGTPLTILKKDKGWYFVQTPDRYLGWTDDVVVMMTAGEFARWTQRPKILVTTEAAFVRQGEDPASPIVSDVVAGNLLALTGESTPSQPATSSTPWPFYRVEYPDGRTAVVPHAMAQRYTAWMAAARDTPDTIVATAKRFMGVPYLWGGTSVKGMDCSGFTKTVYFLNGVLLPRDASQQVEVGEPIDTSAGIDLLPGDLLYFGTRATAQRKERVTHVAISLGGKRFIHASGDVRVNSLAPADPDYSEYRAQTFLRAKRIIGIGPANGVLRLKDLPYYGVSND